MESLGVGEILLTKVNNDGRYVGHDWELIEKVSNSVSTLLPVVQVDNQIWIKRSLELQQLLLIAGSFSKKRNECL